MGGFKSRKIGVKSNDQETVAVGLVHGEEKQLSLDEHGLATMLLTATPRCAALSLERFYFRGASTSTTALNVPTLSESCPSLTDKNKKPVTRRDEVTRASEEYEIVIVGGDDGNERSVGWSGMSFLGSGRSLMPSGPHERPLTGSNVIVPLAVTRKWSPRLTNQSELVQSFFATTSTVIVFTARSCFRGSRSLSDVSEVAGAVTGGGLLTVGFSGCAVSGSRAGGVG